MTEDDLRAELMRRHEATSHSAFGAEPPEVVKQVQTFLNSQGWQPALSVDGQTGPKTNAAVMWWQQAKGLTVDGLIGPQTLASMKLAPAPVAKLQTVNGPSIPGLRQSVVDAFPDFSGKFEGKALPFPYTDSKGYVTTGTGNLMEPFSTFAAQPWRHGVNGPFATADEKQAGYDALKAAWPGVQSVASQSLTDLRLNPGDLDNLLFRTLANNNDYLKAHITGYTQHPADAQLGYHSLAWAYGPGVFGVLGQYGQQMLAAVAQNDFATVAALLDPATAHEQSINPGIVPRIAATKQLFLNADAAVKKKANLDSLYYPGSVTALAALAIGIGGYIAGGVLFIAGLFGYQYYKEHY